MPPKERREIAESGALHRTIPKSHTDVSVGTSNGTYNLLPFANRWVYIRAITADVTIKLGSGNAIANTGEGFVLVAGDPAQEFYVDGGDDLVLNHRAASTATLRILSD